jgi:hypothetical protein
LCHALSLVYSCIMFKYVEGMRKDALIIMSRTYGAKNKTTGQPFFDEYPLKDLVKLLCYEDEEEATAACRHYGITVDGDQILWRHSKFMEPRDPEKGHIIPLKPKKMIRTIESKLHGATRLSVCRGGVSGEGATLSTVTSPESADAAAEMDRMRAQETAEKVKMETMKHLLDAEVKARVQEEIREMEKEKEAKLAAETRARAEAIKMAELMRLEQDRLQRERILAEQRQKEEEARRLAETEAEARRVERDRQEREALEREEARKKAEEEEMERERQRLQTKHREEEKRRMAQFKAAREQAVKEQRVREEKRRLAEFTRKVEEDRIKRAQEEEARQIEIMWREKIEKARKILAWRLWRKQMHMRESLEQSRQCLGRLDPTSTQFLTPPTRKPSKFASQQNSIRKNERIAEVGLESHIFRLATASRHPIDVSKMVAQSLNSLILETAYPPNLLSIGNVILFKLTVWLPQKKGIESLYDSLRMWVNSHLRVGKVYTHTFKRRSRSINIRAVSVIGNEQTLGSNDSNAVLLLLPCVAESSPDISFPEKAKELLPSNISRVVLVLGNNKCGGNTPSTETIIRHEAVITPKVCDFDHAFEECCETVVKLHFENICGRTQLYSHGSISIARVSLANLGLLCLQRLMQNMDSEGCFRLPSSDDSVFSLSKHTLTLLVRELSHASNEAHLLKHNYPPLEFCDKETSSVPAFFDWKFDLPRNWHLPLKNISRIVFDVFQVMLDKVSFVELVENFGPEMPLFLRQKIFNMIDNGDIPRCFVDVVSLLVDGELSLKTTEENIVYLPVDAIAQIIERVASYNIPFVPDRVPMDVPSYLYSPLRTEQVQRGGETTTPGIEKVEKVANKRKPPERIESESPVHENVKRGRTRATLTVESEEQRKSKEFTAFLRHCFETN